MVLDSEFRAEGKKRGKDEDKQYVICWHPLPLNERIIHKRMAAQKNKRRRRGPVSSGHATMSMARHGFYGNRPMNPGETDQSDPPKISEQENIR